MTRVDIPARTEFSVPEIKTAKPHRFHLRPHIGGCCGCLLLQSLALLILIGLGMFALASTGLTTVPIFSHWYRTPQPTRIVTPSEQTLESSVEQQLRTQSDLIRRNPSGSKTFSVLLGERELSRTLRDALAASLGDMVIEQAQVAVDEEGMEWYARVKKGDQHPVVTLQMQPALANGKLSLKVRHVELGTLPIWHTLVDMVLNRAVTEALVKINKNIFSIAEIQSVSLHQGSIEIIGILKK